MHNFRTEVNLRPSIQVDHKVKFFTSGSCFADHLGNQLHEHKFTCSVNPFGVSYNPIAIHQALLLSLTKQAPPEQLYIQSQDTWRHLFFHSQWAHESKQSLMDRLHIEIEKTGTFIKDTNIVILTYGTAWGYRHKDTDMLVANCHKLPAALFDKILLSPAQIISSFKSLYESLREMNQHTRFILTVSPVRHTRDTLELNQVSKSSLRLACHYITQQFEHVEYFPAYEILMDDLRDYRFYEGDMIHPSAVAREYIWEKFTQRFFSSGTQQLVGKIAFVKKSLAHRPFHSDSPTHQTFLRELLTKLQELNLEVDMHAEIKFIQSQLLK